MKKHNTSKKVASRFHPKPSPEFKPKTKSKVFFIILSFLAIAVFYSFSQKSGGAGIQVTSHEDSNVEINGRSVGKTPYYVENLREGITDVKLSNIKTGQVWSQQTKLTKGTLTTIHREFNSDANKSHSYTLSFDHLADKDKSTVYITSGPLTTTVSVDGKPQGFTPLTVDTEPGAHVFSFTSPGYEDKVINAAAQLGYQLNINFSMASLITSPQTSDPKPVDSKTNPLSFNTLVKTSLGILEVQTSTDMVEINPLEYSQSSIRYTRIEKDEYPKLFIQGQANQSSISVDTSRAQNNPPEIILSNNAPDHGGLSPTYQLTINLLTGQITENNHPQRDATLTPEENSYLARFPQISDLVGNGSYFKLLRGAQYFGGFRLETLVVEPITYANGEQLYVFDGQGVYIQEKGYEMKLTRAGNTLTVKFKKDFPGIGDGKSTVKIYEVDSQTKTVSKTKEYEE